MTIFDIISSLLYKKERAILDVEGEKTFSLYMVCRWVSMYAPDKAILINTTVNKWWSVFDTKQEQYDFLFTLLNKSRFKKINYLKKVKREKKVDVEEAEIEKMAAHNNFMSVREYRELKRLALG